MQFSYSHDNPFRMLLQDICIWVFCPDMYSLSHAMEPLLRDVFRQAKEGMHHNAVSPRADLMSCSTVIFLSL